MEDWMLQHATKQQTKEFGRIEDAAACTTQCRGMCGQMKIRAEDRIVDATAYYLGCCGMALKLKKFKSLILIRLLVYVGF